MAQLAIHFGLFVDGEKYTLSRTKCAGNCNPSEETMMHYICITHDMLLICITFIKTKYIVLYTIYIVCFKTLILNQIQFQFQP